MESAVKTKGFSPERMRRYAQMGRPLPPEEEKELFELREAMWRMIEEHSDAITPADMVRLVLKPVLHPAEQRKGCDCLSCKARKEGNG